MSPLVWDLAHIAAYEDSGSASATAAWSCCAPTWRAVYDAFETPRAVRGEVELLDAAAARDYLEQCAPAASP